MLVMSATSTALIMMQWASSLFPVRKLAGSICTWMLELASGSATSIVPARIAKLPRTGASPNRCRVLNVTAEPLVSISYRPGRGVTCVSGVPIMAPAAPVLARSGLEAAIPFLPIVACVRVLCTLGGQPAPDVTRKWTCQVESSGRHRGTKVPVPVPRPLLTPAPPRRPGPSQSLFSLSGSE